MLPTSSKHRGDPAQDFELPLRPPPAHRPGQRPGLPCARGRHSSPARRRASSAARRSAARRASESWATRVSRVCSSSSTPATWAVVTRGAVGMSSGDDAGEVGELRARARRSGGAAPGGRRSLRPRPGRERRGRAGLGVPERVAGDRGADEGNLGEVAGQGRAAGVRLADRLDGDLLQLRRGARPVGDEGAAALLADDEPGSSSRPA